MGDSMHTAIAPRERLRADARKQQIVQVVLALIAERGVDGVSTQLIADTIGLTQGAVFRHFSTKEEVWSAVMSWLEDQLQTIWSKARLKGQDHDGITVLEHMFLGHIELIERYPGLAKLIMSDHVRQQFPSLNQRFAVLAQEYTREVEEVINDIVKEAKLPKSFDREAAVTLYFCAIQGLGFQFSIARLKPSLRKEAPRIFKLLLRALGIESAVATRR
jgi:TetR/AcrR family transcriptional regulator